MLCMLSISLVENFTLNLCSTLTRIKICLSESQPSMSRAVMLAEPKTRYRKL